MGCHVGKLTNMNQNVTRYGYMRDEIAYKLQTSHLSMDKLYAGEFEEVRAYLGPQGVDELKKFISYLPKLDLEISC